MVKRRKRSGLWIVTHRATALAVSALTAGIGLTVTPGCTFEPDVDEQTGAEQLDLMRRPHGAWHGRRGHGRNNHSPTCSVRTDTDDLVAEFSTGFRRHGELSLRSSFRSKPISGDRFVELDIRRGGRDLMRVTIESHSSTGAVRVATEYAHPIRGVRRSIVDSADGLTFRATVDGRTSNPFSAGGERNVTFSDGAPAPVLRMEPHLRRAISDLLETTTPQAVDCWRRKLRPGVLSSENDVELDLTAAAPDFGQPAQSAGDPDISTGVNFFTCLLAWAGCNYATYGCITGGLSLSLGCGPAFWACAAISVGVCTGLDAACGDTIQQSASCCPVSCGGGFFARSCCASDEQCLSPDRRVCCGAGKSACGFDECCSGDQTCCFASRLGVDTCCSATDICTGEGCCDPSKACVSECCGAGEQCVQGVRASCCEMPRVCGEVCCDPGFLCNTADPSNPRCCPSSSVICNGECCPGGWVCGADGTCVEPPPGSTCTIAPCTNANDCVPFQGPFSRTLQCDAGACCFEPPG